MSEGAYFFEPEVIELTKQDDGGYSTNDGTARPWEGMPRSVRARICREENSNVRRILKETGLWTD